MSYKLLTNLLFEPRGKHNPSLTYNIKDTVMSEDGSKVYFALDNVPAGIPLTDTNYWMLQIDLSASKAAMDTAAANARTQTNETIASANTRVEDMMGKAAEAVTSVADYATKVGMRVKGETKITKGNPITIYPDGGSLLKVQTDIPIKQLGEGDPYPGGAGKNLLPITAKTQTSNGVTFTVDNGAITVNGTATANAYLWLCDEFTLQPGTYIMSGIPENFDFTTQGGFADDNWNINRYGVTTLTEAKKVHPYVIIRNGVTANNVIFKLQLEAGSTATSYVPSSNIRPFVGYDELGLSVARKNLLPNTAVSVTKNGLTYTVNNDGSITVNGTCDSNSFFTVCESIKLPKGEYILSGNPKGITYSQVRLYVDKYDSMTESHKITLETAKALIVNIVVFRGEVLNNVIFKPMLRLASDTDATYVPYQGTLHTVQLDKTTYQGHYDWMIGKFRAEWGVYTLTGDGSTKLLSASTYNAKCFMSDVIPNMVGNSTIMNGAKSSHFVEGVWNDIVAMASPFGKFAINTSNKIGFAYDGTIDEANAWLVAQNAAGTPVQFAYKLATPIEIQLAPNVITAVEDGGVNHIYGDADLTVEWVKTLETSLTEHSNAKVDANNEALLTDVAQKERSVGNLVVINDAVANVAFPHVVTEFAPKQSGSGDPYPAGGGRNLLPPCPAFSRESNGITITSDGNGKYSMKGTAAGTMSVVVDLEHQVSLGDVVVIHTMNNVASDAVSMSYYRPDGTQITWTTLNVVNRIQNNPTLPNETVAKFGFYVADGRTVDIEYTPMILTDENPTSFIPYSNIRPITGYDKLELMRCGKNLLNNVRYYDSTHTDIRAQYDSPLLLKAGVKYVLSTNFKADGLFFVDAAGNGSLEAQYLFKYQYDISSLEYTPERDIECIFAAIFNSGVPDGATIQLEVGSATAHTPYQGALHTVYIDETVYGGHYNWLTGKLVAEWYEKNFDGTESWGIQTGPGGLVRFWLHDDDIDVGDNENIWNTKICSHAKETLNANSTYGASNSFAVYAAKDIYINLGFNTLDDLKSYLAAQHAAGTPVQIAYKLSTPIEIQLDPTRITTIPGTNTIFGDGEFTIDWFKSYKKVAEERENLLLDSFTDKAELSGNPIAMSPVGGLPFDSVVTEFTPKQAGSGDPYPAGGGRNLCNGALIQGTRSTTGVLSVGTAFTAVSIEELVPVASGMKVYVTTSIGAFRNVYRYYVYDANKQLIITEGGIAQTASVTMPDGAAYFAFQYSGQDYADFIGAQVMVAYGEFSEYAPYSNIRPITGYDKLDLNHAGKNIMPVLSASDSNSQGVEWKNNKDGSWTANGTAIYAAYITGGGMAFALGVLPAGEYKLDVVASSEETGKLYLRIGSGAGAVFLTSNDSQSKDKECTFVADGVTEYYVAIAIKSGETVKDYRIFPVLVDSSHSVYSINIGQTVYGGKFGWLTGKLVAEWTGITFDGTENWKSDGNWFYLRFDNLVKTSNYTDVVKCSHFVASINQAFIDLSAGGISGYYNPDVEYPGKNWIYARFSGADTVEKHKAYLAAQKAAGTPVQVAYKLTTPIEIQLTPTEIIALTGVNTLYGDGDTITAKFRQSKDVDILKRLSALETLMTNQTKGE